MKLLLLKFVELAVQDKEEMWFPDKEASHAPSSTETPPSNSHGMEMAIR